MGSTSTAPTFATLNDDVLLAIGKYIPLTCREKRFTHQRLSYEAVEPDRPLNYMYNLSQTCKRFHTFFRTPQIVLSLFRSSPPFHAIMLLASFPKWAHRTPVVDAITAGPKALLLYVELFLFHIQHRKGLGPVFCQMLWRATTWYQNSFETGGHLLSVLFNRDRDDLPSAERFVKMARTGGADEIDKGLRWFIEEENFPLSEFFIRQNGSGTISDGEGAILRHRKVRNILTLSDIVSRLYPYVVQPSTQELVKSLFERAPRHEILLFQKHVQYLFDTKSKWELWKRLVEDYPSTISASSENIYRLRCNIRSSSTRQLQSQISLGVSVNFKHLYYDLSYIIEEKGDVEGWCQAISALQARQPDLAWCEDLDLKYHSKDPEDIHSPEAIFNHLMTSALDCVMEPSYKDWPARGEWTCGPVTPQFERLEASIRSGKIQWRPPAADCMTYLEDLAKWNGDAPRRCEALLRWLKDKYGSEGEKGGEGVGERVRRYRYPRLRGEGEDSD
ncbi:hypothetical protein HDV00_004393 [Rhizophlyctis rosea]|nr:hypothetical protein HDV00_004393 [Rhizophlyctis rosea]